MADEKLKVEEFCLNGEFNLGARYQGYAIDADEFYPSSWCITSDNQGNKVLFTAAGKANPDMDGSYSVQFNPPSTVLLVSNEGAVNLAFEGAMIGAEALRHKRLDPAFIVREINDNQQWIIEELPADANVRKLIVQYPGTDFPVTLRVVNNKLQSFSTKVDLPLRGRVPLTWKWHWSNHQLKRGELIVDNKTFFRGAVTRKVLNEQSAKEFNQRDMTPDSRKIPGKAWPARASLRIQKITDDVYLVTGVRTGFNHLVVDSEKGLIIADAPAGWGELHQIPPADLVPGLEISGLSERFVDFLRKRWPEKPIAAVVLTHSHDDHAGGARAFAAEGAKIYAHHVSAAFLQKAFNRKTMPSDRLSFIGNQVSILPINNKTQIATQPGPVEILPINDSPHAPDLLGLYLPQQKLFFVSDIHVPGNEEPAPRADKVLTDCWFAGWTKQNLPGDVEVWNSHNRLTTPVSRLSKYLDHELCQKAE